MKYSLIKILLFSIVLSGCGEISSSGDRVNINVNAVPSTAGTVLSSGGDEVGNTAEFLAVPNDGWQFENWSGDVESDENPLVMELEDDLNLIANFRVMSNNYRIDLEMSDGQSAVDLAFGQVSGATDVFDSGIDLEAPPSAAPNSLFAWFDNDERKLFHDFRNSVSSSVEWVLNVEPGENSKVSLNWQMNDGYFDGNLYLTDADETFTLDMNEEDSVSIEVTSPTQVYIYFKK
ncbi:InlB B-repeat-containing protein [Rhodohalobacter halophilus]|uniref:InlB B-repeat-containing protein n=1 Tax=Rhodohalobacter halophilus TaxID=1812810 RepID=UPI00083F68BE|nr:hypothetical protein [Rhodohalobacter halophilus]